MPKSLTEVDNGQVRGLRGVLCLLRPVRVASHLFAQVDLWRGTNTRASQVLGFGADLGPDHPVR